MTVDLLRTVISSMEKVESLHGKASGKYKKEKALLLIQYSLMGIMGRDAYELIADMIPGMIEMVISLSKNEMVIEVNRKISKKCFKLCGL